MERVRERAIWLLSLIYPSKDIRGIWGALKLGDSAKQAYAVELLDNLLTGDVKRYMFPFYGVAALDRNPAVHTLKALDAVHARKLSAQDFDDILSVDFECVRSSPSCSLPTHSRGTVMLSG